MILLQLFFSFLQIGLFSVGGGYAAMPLIQSQVVEHFHWLTMKEFTDLITIAEMTPGPIAINSATFVGQRIAGFAGSVISVLGCITPSLIIVSILAKIYIKYRKASGMQAMLSCLRPVVVALIASAGLTILGVVIFGEGASQGGTIPFHWIGLALSVGAFLVLRIKKASPILVMVICGIISLILYFIGIPL